MFLVRCAIGAIRMAVFGFQQGPRGSAGSQPPSCASPAFGREGDKICDVVIIDSATIEADVPVAGFPSTLSLGCRKAQNGVCESSGKWGVSLTIGIATCLQLLAVTKAIPVGVRVVGICRRHPKYLVTIIQAISVTVRVAGVSFKGLNFRSIVDSISVGVADRWIRSAGDLDFIRCPIGIPV